MVATYFHLLLPFWHVQTHGEQRLCTSSAARSSSLGSTISRLLCQPIRPSTLLRARKNVTPKLPRPSLLSRGQRSLHSLSQLMQLLLGPVLFLTIPALLGTKMGRTALTTLFTLNQFSSVGCRLTVTMSVTVALEIMVFVRLTLRIAFWQWSRVPECESSVPGRMCSTKLSTSKKVSALRTTGPRLRQEKGYMKMKKAPTKKPYN